MSRRAAKISRSLGPRDLRQTALRHEAIIAAIAQGDTEAARETVQKIAAFNKSHPAIAINANSIRRSLQSRQRYSERAVNGVVIGKNLQGEVNDRVRFGRDDAE